MKKYFQRPDVKEKVRTKSRERMRVKRQNEEFRGVENAKRRGIHHKNKLKVMTHYSKGKPCCECCKIRDLEFLTIDHPNGGGQKERRAIKRSPGREFYAWLVKEGLPEGYRVLCFNCNSVWGFLGYCPHVSEKIRIFFEELEYSPLYRSG